MTRTKTTKLIAIIMAVFMTFAFMSVSLISVSADPAPATQTEQKDDTQTTAEEDKQDAEGETDDTDGSSQKTPENPSTEDKTPTAPRPSFSISDNSYGAPDITVTIRFGKDLEPELDYASIAKNPNSQDISIQEIRSKLTSNIKVYRNYDENADENKQFTNEVSFGVAYNPYSLKYDATTHEFVFTVPLNSSNKLSSNQTYYLWLGEDLNATKDANNGYVSFVKFTTKTTTRSTSTTRSTYRTITTRNSTVRARSANTDDPSHLPVWIGLVAVSALMLGAVYFVKEKE